MQHREQDASGKAWPMDGDKPHSPTQMEKRKTQRHYALNPLFKSRQRRLRLPAADTGLTILPEDRMREEHPQAALLPAGLERRVRPCVAGENRTVAARSLVEDVIVIIPIVRNANKTPRIVPFPAFQNVFHKRIILRSRKNQPTTICAYARYGSHPCPARVQTLRLHPIPASAEQKGNPSPSENALDHNIS